MQVARLTLPLLRRRTFKTIMNSSKVTEDERQAILAGAPFDEDGNSTANVYYTVQDLNAGTWLFNFYLFYSWNGCSNQVGTRAICTSSCCRP